MSRDELAQQAEQPLLILILLTDGLSLTCLLELLIAIGPKLDDAMTLHMLLLMFDEAYSWPNFSLLLMLSPVVSVIPLAQRGPVVPLIPQEIRLLNR